MHVESEHRIDSSGPNADGMFDYYYEYDTYVFSEGGESLTGRSYSDNSLEAHFLSITVDGIGRPLTRADLGRPLLKAAMAYLQTVGKVTFNWLGGGPDGYGPIA